MQRMRMGPNGKGSTRELSITQASLAFRRTSLCRLVRVDWFSQMTRHRVAFGGARILDDRVDTPEEWRHPGDVLPVRHGGRRVVLGLWEERDQIGGFCTFPQKGAVGLKSLTCSYLDEQTSEVSAHRMAQNISGDTKKAVMRHLLRHTDESSHAVLSEIRYELLRQRRTMPAIG